MMERSDLSSEAIARLARVVVLPQVSIAEAIGLLDKSGVGILLVCEAERQLLGTISDGDIRRAILRGTPMNSPCVQIANTHPAVAVGQVSSVEALHIMNHGKSFIVHHLPIVSSEGQVEGLLLRSDFTQIEDAGLSAVIMAGGAGTRLRPLTNDLPKPMLPVGDRPLMALILAQMRRAGIRRVNVTTHYMAEKIKEYFGDGQSYEMDIRYVTEDRPLGTAGGLSLMEPPTEPLLVINGDILTRIDFRAMLEFHRNHQAAMTVAVRQYDVQVPYGVFDCDGPYVKRIEEKPRLNYLVNAGVYLLEPAAYQYIPAGQQFDMTDLIQRLLDEGRPVVSFPVIEYWLDIGQHADYEQAQRDVQNGVVK
jgi:dTDP-glucose pyrophosphorylase/CBS domain-containing protein